MVPKIEYGDLYKFLVSIGLVLVALAFVVPWLLFEDSSDLLIPVSTLETLSPNAQESIRERQNLIGWYSRNALNISIALVVLGAAFMAVGLWNWWKMNQQF